MTSVDHATGGRGTVSHGSKVIWCFAAVYLIWGSTYLAIRYAVETLPPALSASVRFFISGAILMGIALHRGAAWPSSLKEIRNCGVVGVLLVLGGNGGVVWAAQYVPSGLMALMLAATPFWMTAMESFWKGGDRPNGLGILGLVVGFTGVGTLLWPDLNAGILNEGGASMQLVGQLVLLAAAFSWAFGSIFARHSALPFHPLMTVSWQMIIGSVALLVFALVRGEWNMLEIDTVSAKSWLAMVYLIVFGACIGFTSYIWLLRNVPASRVSTYAYVNPLVAVLLGWIVAGEPLDWTFAAGMAVILAGVVLVTHSHRRTETEGIRGQ